MSKRSYTKIGAMEQALLGIRKSGKTNREIAERFGLELKQVKCWVTRYNRKQAKLSAGILPRPKGRPGKDGQPPHQGGQTELERLRMENKLLRDFLQSIGRM